MESPLLTFGIITFGLFAAWLGVMVRMGKLRWLFFGGNFPVLAPVGAFLIATPMGLGITTIGLMAIFPDYKDPLTIPMLFFFLTGVILGFWTPNWLMPDWMCWLIENYEHVLGGMFEEARQMGIKQWEQETRTKVELATWADEVARRNGWRRLP